MESELARYDWTALDPTYGAQIPRALRELRDASSEMSAQNAYVALLACCEEQGAISDAAPAIVACLVMGLFCCTSSARPYVLDAAATLISGVSDISGDPSMPACAACRACAFEALDRFFNVLEDARDLRSLDAAITVVRTISVTNSTLSIRARHYLRLRSIRQEPTDVADYISRVLESYSR